MTTSNENKVHKLDIIIDKATDGCVYILGGLATALAILTMLVAVVVFSGSILYVLVYQPLACVVLLLFYRS